jgi:hypothetical protein
MPLAMHGYKLPLLNLPPPFLGKNNRSALKESIFVEQSILELLDVQCIEEVFVTPDIINPISVSIHKSGKKRLILDLRHVNKSIFKTKFRCEDLTVAKEILKPGDCMFTFDLKSAYHHVEIFPEHRKFPFFVLDVLLIVPFDISNSRSYTVWPQLTPLPVH